MITRIAHLHSPYTHKATVAIEPPALTPWREGVNPYPASSLLLFGSAPNRGAGATIQPGTAELMLREDYSRAGKLSMREMTA
jgi:hypothetical protein